jgi:hypothetical protein
LQRDEPDAQRTLIANHVLLDPEEFGLIGDDLMGYTVGNTPPQVFSANVYAALGAVRNDMTFDYRHVEMVRQPSGSPIRRPLTAAICVLNGAILPLTICRYGKGVCGRDPERYHKKDC